MRYVLNVWDKRGEAMDSIEFKSLQKANVRIKQYKLTNGMFARIWDRKKEVWCTTKTSEQ